MTSRAIRCRDAIIDLLNTDAPTDFPTATKLWLFPGAPFEGSRISVFMNQEPAQYPRGDTRSAITDRERMMIVQLASISEDGADLDDQAEELREWVVEALGDTNLGGLALSVEDRGILEPPARYKLDRYHILVHCGWAVRFQTKRDDLSVQA
jgi:hypothetical protein